MALSSKSILCVLRVEGEILAQAARRFGKLLEKASGAKRRAGGVCGIAERWRPIFFSASTTKQRWMRAGKDYIESRKTRGYLNAKAERVKARP
jgi:hypothetical protein